LAGDRYARQRLLGVVGAEGQERIGRASVLVVGCGALGTVQAELLARAGVGRLTLLDRDRVEPSNLQRQVLYDDADAAVGRFKAEAAAARLAAVNPTIALEARVASFGPRNARAQLTGHDLVLDGTDNVETRYTLNDACVEAGIPWVYGGAVGTEGLVFGIRPGSGPCLRCAFPDPPPPGSLATCDTVGVLAAASAMVGAQQVAVALGLLLGDEEAVGRLIRLDPWRARFQVLRIPRAPDCPCCGARRFAFLGADGCANAAALCGQDAVQLSPARDAPVDLRVLADRIAVGLAVEQGPGWLSLAVEGHRLTVFVDGTILVHGTRDPDRARGLAARWIGT
jgi:adenylyltransferase/sulfurtransferase